MSVVDPRSAAFVLLALVFGIAATGAQSAGPQGTLLIVAEHNHESGGVNYPSDIYVVNADGTRFRNVTRDRASNGPAQWMQDGRRIVFESQPADPRRGTPQIYVINSDGTGRRRLTKREGGENPAVSPDGTQIAYLVQRAATADIDVMDADGRRQRRLTHQRGSLFGPAWSADGRLLSFSHEDCSTGTCLDTLLVIGSDGRGLSRLAPVSATEAVWSPTSRTLALGYRYDEMRVADVRSRGPRYELRPVKTIRDAVAYTATWSTDGREIIFNDRNSGTWAVGARDARPRRRYPVQGYLRSLSADGRWVAFVKSRIEPVKVATVTGSNRRIVTRVCCLLDQIAWAPHR